MNRNLSKLLQSLAGVVDVLNGQLIHGRHLLLMILTPMSMSAVGSHWCLVICLSTVLYWLTVWHRTTIPRISVLTPIWMLVLCLGWVCVKDP